MAAVAGAVGDGDLVVDHYTAEAGVAARIVWRARRRNKVNPAGGHRLV